MVGIEDEEGVVGLEAQLGRCLSPNTIGQLEHSFRRNKKDAKTNLKV